MEGEQGLFQKECLPCSTSLPKWWLTRCLLYFQGTNKQTDKNLIANTSIPKVKDLGHSQKLV